jgi:hypothetical protein
LRSVRALGDGGKHMCHWQRPHLGVLLFLNATLIALVRCAEAFNGLFAL